MAFSVSPRTLAQLDWPAIVERLAELTRTSRGRSRCVKIGAEGAAELFEPTIEEVRNRLAETTEARAILDAGDAPPLAGVTVSDTSLRRLAKGGVLGARELLDLKTTLAALRETARFMTARREDAPKLATRCESLPNLRELEEEIDWTIDAEGEVRNSASASLAHSRSQARRLATQLQDRLTAYLRDRDVTECLSDAFYTVRNDRYVLPVRSDARHRVRGIVHDASGSGTTLYIEPEAVVDLNNRLRQAEIDSEREILRLLRELSQLASEALAEIERGLDVIEDLDLAFARGGLSQEMSGSEPIVARDGIYELRQLRHPLLPADSTVPNDLRLGDGYRVLVLSGPNAGGKTVAMKALALAALGIRAGLHVPADAGARVALVDAVLADIGDEQSVRDSLSTFSAHMANLARIVDAAGEHTLVLLDEIGVGTDPSEGAALAQAALETLAASGARVVATTHYNLLKEMADVNPLFANASVEFDPETLEPTYRLHPGVPGASSATAVAARMGLRSDVLQRANALLDSEDRHLDRMLTDLAASRAALETERREAERMRAESDSVRSRYREKLESLQRRRDELFRAMRGELDRAFRGAHAEVAAVIRTLQREGTSARDVARARERLLAIEAQQERVEARIAPDPAEKNVSGVDWRFARPGDPVRIVGGAAGWLMALPDRRGRAAVRVGSARILVDADRISSPAEGPKGTAKASERPARSRTALIRTEPAASESEAPQRSRCDLRGLRVSEAIERVVLALDRAARSGEHRVLIIHGKGTGALRDAVRQHLAESPYVLRFDAAEPGEGGEGATVATLEE